MIDKRFKIFDWISEYSLYSLIFFTPISTALSSVFAGLLLVGFFGKKIINPDFKFLKSKAHFFLLLFFIFSSFSLINSGIYFFKSLNALFLKWAKYIVIFLITQDVLIDKRRIKIALLIFIFIAALVGIDCLSQGFLGKEFLRNRMLISLTYAKAITGPFNHYNGLGTYLVTIIFLVVAIWLKPLQKRQDKFLFGLLAFLLGFCITLTYSRGTWLSFIVTLFLMMILTKRTKPLLFIGIIFILILAFIPQLRYRVFFTLSKGGDADRFIYWNTAIQMIKENPILGKGIGTFMDYFHKYTPYLYPHYAHNCFLQIWAETGIFSLISFLGFVILLVYSGIRSFLDSQDFLTLGITCGIFAFLVHSMFDTQFYSLQLAVIFWLLAAILVARIKFQTNKLDNSLD